MSSLQERFEEAAGKVKNLTKRPTDDELLELYALFKQGTVGDNDTAKPGLFDLKAKYKWDTWNSKKGMPKEEAQEAYIKLAEEQLVKYS